MDPRIDLVEQELNRYRAELAAAIDDVPHARRGDPPAEGGWSAAKVLEHLAESEEAFMGLLEGLVQQAEPRTDGATFSEEDFLRHIDMPQFLDRSRKVQGAQPPGTLSSDEAWGKLEATRRRLLELLRQASGRALEEVRYEHPAMGLELDGHQWFTFVGVHEGRHADQVREIARALT